MFMTPFSFVYMVQKSPSGINLYLCNENFKFEQNESLEVIFDRLEKDILEINSFIGRCE